MSVEGDGANLTVRLPSGAVLGELMEWVDEATWRARVDEIEWKHRALALIEVRLTHREHRNRVVARHTRVVGCVVDSDALVHCQCNTDVGIV